MIAVLKINSPLLALTLSAVGCAQRVVFRPDARPGRDVLCKIARCSTDLSWTMFGVTVRIPAGPSFQ